MIPDSQLYFIIFLISAILLFRGVRWIEVYMIKRRIKRSHQQYREQLKIKREYEEQRKRMVKM